MLSSFSDAIKRNCTSIPIAYSGHIGHFAMHLISATQLEEWNYGTLWSPIPIHYKV